MYVDIPIFSTLLGFMIMQTLLLIRDLLMFLANGLFTFLLFFFHLPLGGVDKQNSGGKRICSVA